MRRSFRLSPSRGIVLVPSRPEHAAAHLTTLQADFITGPTTPAGPSPPAPEPRPVPPARPRRSGDAAQPRAKYSAPSRRAALSAHDSGCAKGCARPNPADLTLVGREGRLRIVLGGSPGDSPTQQLPIEAALERLGRAATLGLAAAFAPPSRMGEEPGDRHEREPERPAPQTSPEASSRYEYVRDGGAIYAKSFAMIRAEADLARWSARAERCVVRMIHACGMTDLPADVEMSDDFAEAGVAALKAGAPILCDVHMVADGVTRARLPAHNEVICTLRDPASWRWRRRWAPPAPRRRWNCGASGCRAASWRSAMRRPPCSGCSNCWTRASRRPPR